MVPSTHILVLRHYTIIRTATTNIISKNHKSTNMTMRTRQQLVAALSVLFCSDLQHLTVEAFAPVAVSESVAGCRQYYDRTRTTVRRGMTTEPAPPSGKGSTATPIASPATSGDDDGDDDDPAFALSAPYEEIQYEDYFDGNRPENAFELAVDNFKRQGKTIFSQAAEALGLQQKDPRKPPYNLGLRLSNEAVTETERLREEGGGEVVAHPVSKALYDVGCLFLDRLFDERPIQRFWFLEVIARIPYFSYISMLHLYESLGWWRAVELRKVHNAQEWNELHHLLIMESLGGNAVWSDRFLAYHVAIVYYWFLNLVFLGSPRIAYQFMELLEAHAVDTYGTFVRTNRKRLKELPAPKVAVSYYTTGDLYLFDDFQLNTRPGSRRPPCDSLLDVFENICQDEAEHVMTMQACQNYALLGDKVVSPHVEYPKLEEKRSLWEEWSGKINTEPSEMDGF